MALGSSKQEAGAVTGCHSPSRAANDGLRDLAGCPGALVAVGPVCPGKQNCSLRSG